jgi:hypothetical protein
VGAARMTCSCSTCTAAAPLWPTAAAGGAA